MLQAAGCQSCAALETVSFALGRAVLPCASGLLQGPLLHSYACCLLCSSQYGDAVAAAREVTLMPTSHADVSRCVARASSLHPALASLVGAVVASAGKALAAQVSRLGLQQVHTS